MGIRIKRVGVLGAGVMGQGIAAHLANAGIPSYLFDIAPGELTDQEQAAGLTLEDRAVRNRISQAGIDSMLKASPALLYRKALGSLVTPCNYVDDAERLGECDWIVEAVIERMDIKQQVFTMVDEHRKEGSVVSTNTSGLSAVEMAEGRSEDFVSHFMVTHFFNPVRYMRLLEVVPLTGTDPGVFAAMAEFGEEVLGKGIVYAKDTPNFIANRIGIFGFTSVFHWMQEYGIPIPIVDKVFGPAMGRPRSAVFRTADVVGLDTMGHVVGTLEEQCTDDPWHERFAIPPFLEQLISDGRLGSKSGAGFYKKIKNAEGKSEILALDLGTLDYVAQEKVRLDILGAALGKEKVADKMKTMVWFDDDYGRFAWKVTAESCIYSAQMLGEIADDVVNIDRAMRWGFNYEAGPFETWDAIGVAESVARMKEEGMEVPAVVDALLEKGEGTWYVNRDGKQFFWDAAAEEYAPVPQPEGIVFIPALADQDRKIDGNMGATLYDMGDGVGLVEFHTKMNSIDAAIVEMIDKGVGMVNDGELVGLVVGNEATNFSVGANIGLVAMLAMNKDWDTLDEAVAGMQNAYMGIKYCSGPVVIAPRGMALGGGCECVMHGASVRAAAETYIGLVELGVGVIPAAGGCKEMAFRYYGSVPDGVNAELMPFLERLFRIVGTATVATSAEEGREYGFLSRHDKVSLSPDTVLADAKADVLAMASTGYKPPLPRKVPVPGSSGIAALSVAVHGMQQGGYISEYDEHLGKMLARVICGGDVPTGTRLSEQDFLDLEREAFLSLAGEEKTQARIMHMLEKGKPLRN